MEKVDNDTIDLCIETIAKLIRPNCDDHTPYRGDCVSCGRRDNYDILPDPQGVIFALIELKTA